MTTSRLRLAQHAHGLQGVRLTVRLCARNKPSHHRPYGLLQPLPVPGRPWHSISMDFIEQLLASNGFTTVLVVIDPVQGRRFHSNYRHCYCPRRYRCIRFLFVLKAWHPLHVSSDRGSEFASHFFHSLGPLLRLRLHSTSGHRSSANGQVERANSILEQYLRMYYNY